MKILEELKKLDYSHLDKIIDILGNFSTDNPENEKQEDKIQLILLSGNEEIKKAIEKVKKKKR